MENNLTVDQQYQDFISRLTKGAIRQQTDPHFFEKPRCQYCNYECEKLHDGLCIICRTGLDEESALQTKSGRMRLRQAEDSDNQLNPDGDV